VSEADFSEFVAARWPRLVRSGVLLGCSEHEAQDLAQNTLARCFQSWHKVQAADDEDAYVYRILTNTLKSSRKRRWWGEAPTEVLPDDGADNDHSSPIALSHGVRRALLALPIEQRAVVVLRYFADLSEQQTADALGIPNGTVKSRASRALAQLAADADLTELAES